MLHFLPVALLFASSAASEKLLTPDVQEGAQIFVAKIGALAGVDYDKSGPMATAFVSLLDKQPSAEIGPFSPIISAIHAKLAQGAGVDPVKAVAFGSYVGSLFGRPDFQIPRVTPGTPLAVITPYVGIQLAQMAGVDPKFGKKMGEFFGATLDKGPRNDVHEDDLEFPAKVLSRFAKKAGVPEDVGAKLGAYLGRHFGEDRCVDFC